MSTVIPLASVAMVISGSSGPSPSHLLGEHVSPTHSFALASNSIRSRAHLHSVGASVSLATLAIFAFTRHHQSPLDNHFQCHSSVATPSQRSLFAVICHSKEPLLGSILAPMPSQSMRLSSFHSSAAKAIIHQAATLSRRSLSPSHFRCYSFTHCTATMSASHPLFFFSIVQT